MYFNLNRHFLLFESPSHVESLSEENYTKIIIRTTDLYLQDKIRLTLSRHFKSAHELIILILWKAFNLSKGKDIRKGVLSSTSNGDSLLLFFFVKKVF